MTGHRCRLNISRPMLQQHGIVGAACMASSRAQARRPSHEWSGPQQACNAFEQPSIIPGFALKGAKGVVFSCLCNHPVHHQLQQGFLICRQLTECVICAVLHKLSGTQNPLATEVNSIASQYSMIICKVAMRKLWLACASASSMQPAASRCSSPNFGHWHSQF